MIVPPEGGKAKPYNRTSSFGDVLDDKSNITKWKLRHVVKGLVNRSDLWVRACETPIENKAALDKIAEEAMVEAGINDASEWGTQMHLLTEQFDRGEPIGPILEGQANDLGAYQRAVTHDDPFAFVHIERFMVCDELEAAGTPDRLGRRMKDGETTYRPLQVCDLKTSASANYLDKHAVQLAIYAHSDLYDPATGERESVDVAKDCGYIFHLPARQGTFQLFKLDLVAGWEAAQLAADVRRWRKRRGLAVPA